MKIVKIMWVLIFSVSAHAWAQTNSAPEVRFAPKTVRVIDKLTGKPVSGAIVSPIHLHPTNAYAAKTYLTDTNGIVNPVVDVADYSAFKVTKEGYDWERYAFFDHTSTNRVIPITPLKATPELP